IASMVLQPPAEQAGQVLPAPQNQLHKMLCSVWFRLVFVLLLMAIVQPFLVGILYFTGDEPHYLLATVSFFRDGDFNLKNNYQQEHFREFGAEFLSPQWGNLNKDAVIPAEHGTVYPLLIAPAYAIGKDQGVRSCQILLAFACCLLLGWLVDILTGNRL